MVMGIHFADPEIIPKKTGLGIVLSALSPNFF